MLSNSKQKADTQLSEKSELKSNSSKLLSAKEGESLGLAGRSSTAPHQMIFKIRIHFKSDLLAEHVNIGRLVNVASLDVDIKLMNVMVR